MYKNKTFLAVIPARGGSKGLPRKNIKNLCGKPLVAWSIEAGLKSRYIDEVMVTTDDIEIARVSKEFGANVPFLRPKELATDTATTFDAVKHTIDFYRDKLKKEFDYIVLLEPTSPLREENDIDNMIVKIVESGDRFSSIISIGEVHEHPSIMKTIDSEILKPFCKELKLTNRRQDNKSAYFPYGVAYIVNIDNLLKEKRFYTEKNTYYKIKRYQCYEIDDIYDFLAIETIMKYQNRIER